MKKYFKSFIIISVLLLLYNCSDNSDDDLNFMYPINVGNQWQYLRILNTTSFIPDTILMNLGVPDTTKVISEIIGTEFLHDSIETYVFKASELYDQNVYFSIDYYKSTPEGLFVMAYQNAGGGPIILPKKPVYNAVKFKSYSFVSIYQMAEFVKRLLPKTSIRSDSITFEDPPVQALEYPLAEGSQWTYRQNYGSFRIDKIVIGTQMIKLDLGSFNCYHIKWLYDIDGDGEWDEDIWIDDYLNEKGLIKRKITVLNLIITNENGNELGNFDFIEEDILTEFYLFSG